MITVTKLENLGAYKNGWLNAKYHFNFASHYDAARTGLGPLLVWNDDTIQPGTGFDPHGHRDMEIITYVRRGAITHKDNLGNVGRTEAGDVQVMSAGSGIQHAEYNLEDTETTLFQIWIEPKQIGMTPRWDSRKFPKGSRNDGESFVILASGRPNDAKTDALIIHQDAAVLGASLAADGNAVHYLGGGRKAYIVPAKGEIKINGIPAPERSGTIVRDEDNLTIHATSDAEIVIVDVA